MEKSKINRRLVSFAQGEVAARSVTGSVRSTRRWASLRQHVAANEGGKPRIELLLDPPASKSSTPSSQPHTPNTPRTPHTPSRKSNWEVIEHFTGAPRPSIVTVSIIATRKIHYSLPLSPPPLTLNLPRRGQFPLEFLCMQSYCITISLCNSAKFGVDVTDHALL